MNTEQIIAVARKHATTAKHSLQGSAKICLSDAVKLYNDGNYKDAKKLALRSIAYSVGVYHADYVRG